MPTAPFTAFTPSSSSTGITRSPWSGGASCRRMVKNSSPMAEVHAARFSRKGIHRPHASGSGAMGHAVTIGQPGDPEHDPTILWPNNRKEVRAGTLTLWSAMPDPKAGSYKINFDPLMMADGIEATNDPILLFRSPSYAVSHTRRLRDL